jgi:recombination protein RecR
MSMGDIKGLLETAQRIQSEVARVREELGRKTVEGETGAAFVRCTVSGRGEVLSLTIDDAIVGDKKMIEDLAVGAVNVALAGRARWRRPISHAPRAACRCPPGCSGPDGCSRRPSRAWSSSSGSCPGSAKRPRPRLAFHILRASPEDAAALAAAIAEVKQKIRFCSICCDLTEADPCGVCRDARRDAGPGLRRRPAPGRRRHRTGGRLPRPRTTCCTGCCRPWTASARRPAGDGADPALRAAGRRRGTGDGVREAILATSPSVEGRPPLCIWRSCCARSACGHPHRHRRPIGGELEYADQLTLARAIDGRRDM